MHRSHFELVKQNTPVWRLDVMWDPETNNWLDNEKDEDKEGPHYGPGYDSEGSLNRGPV
jgi:hypothetical protein